MTKVAPIRLGVVDDATLDELVRVAINQAAPYEVVAPIPGPPGWTAPRIAWLREFHQARRPGLAGAHKEETFSILQLGIVIGSARLAEVAPNTLETGMWLARSVRGHGFGAEVLRLLMAEASSRGAQHMIAHTTATNVGALGALRKCGAMVGYPDTDGRIMAQFEIAASD